MFKNLVTKEFADAGITIGGSKPQDIEVKNDRFYSRVAIFNSLGLGDEWSDRGFKCANLREFLWRLMRHQKEKRRALAEKHPWTRNLPGSLPEAWIRLQLRVSNQQTIARARRVGKRHYDLGNDFYSRMLDPSMAYSCGYWTGAATLEKAQENKYRIICEKLGLKSGMRVLEIGCGWGGFAAFAAAAYGVNVVGVSISERQIEGARTKYKELCAIGALDFRFMDYRDIPKIFAGQKFDAIVSIGMFEHVGPSNYNEYMRIAHYCLKPGRPFLLHTIVGRGGVDPFLWYRIFPGGILPTEEQIAAAVKPYFVIEHMENFGYDYARTLEAWRKNLTQNWDWVQSRYGEPFYRMFEFYLTACEVAFRLRSIHLEQWVLVKDGTPLGYQWNRPVY